MDCQHCTFSGSRFAIKLCCDPNRSNQQSFFRKSFAGNAAFVCRPSNFSFLQDGNLSSRVVETGERRVYLTNRLQKALETTAPLLREVLSDFRSFLQKTLLGTHGQEIMNDAKGMVMENPVSVRLGARVQMETFTAFFL